LSSSSRAANPFYLIKIIKIETGDSVVRILTANLNTLWKEEMIVAAIFSLDDEMTLFNS